jgi:hypothetical protein
MSDCFHSFEARWVSFFFFWVRATQIEQNMDTPAFNLAYAAKDNSLNIFPYTFLSIGCGDSSL